MNNSLYFSNKLIFNKSTINPLGKRLEELKPELKKSRKNKLKKSRNKQRGRRKIKRRAGKALKQFNQSELLKLILQLMGKGINKDNKVIKEPKKKKMKLAKLRGVGVSRGGYGIANISSSGGGRKTPQRKGNETSNEYLMRVAEDNPMLALVYSALTSKTQREAEDKIKKAVNLPTGELANVSKVLSRFYTIRQELQINTTITPEKRKQLDTLATEVFGGISDELRDLYLNQSTKAVREGVKEGKKDIESILGYEFKLEQQLEEQKKQLEKVKDQDKDKPQTYLLKSRIRANEEALKRQVQNPEQEAKVKYKFYTDYIKVIDEQLLLEQNSNKKKNLKKELKSATNESKNFNIDITPVEDSNDNLTTTEAQRKIEEKRKLEQAQLKKQIEEYEKKTQEEREKLLQPEPAEIRNLSNPNINLLVYKQPTKEQIEQLQQLEREKQEREKQEKLKRDRSIIAQARIKGLEKKRLREEAEAEAEAKILIEEAEAKRLIEEAVQIATAPQPEQAKKEEPQSGLDYTPQSGLDYIEKLIEDRKQIYETKTQSGLWDLEELKLKKKKLKGFDKLLKDKKKENEDIKKFLEQRLTKRDYYYYSTYIRKNIEKDYDAFISERKRDEPLEAQQQQAFFAKFEEEEKKK